MLRLSNSIAPILIQKLIITQVSGSRDDVPETINNMKLKLEVAAVRAAIDCFIVGGIAFFSSFAALGYSDIILNIKFSVFSSVTIAGLTFFSELKSSLKK